jgi:hypothetical protein
VESVRERSSGVETRKRSGVDGMRENWSELAQHCDGLSERCWKANID